MLYQRWPMSIYYRCRQAEKVGRFIITVVTYCSQSVDFLISIAFVVNCINSISEFESNK